MVNGKWWKLRKLVINRMNCKKNCGKKYKSKIQEKQDLLTIKIENDGK